MAKLTVNIGTSANDRTGDNLRTAFNKINQNFDELYTELGLDSDGTLNLGNFVFENNTVRLTNANSDDSTATQIEIAQPVRIESDLTVGGDVVPNTANGGDLGSPAKPWRSLYVSNNTIYIGGVAIGVDGNGDLTLDGTVVGGTPAWDNVTDKPTFAAVATSNSYADLSNKPTIPEDVGDLTDTGNLLSAGPASELTSNDDINITINNNDSSAYTWNFGQTGDLTLPSGGLLGQVWGDGIDTELTLKSPPGVGDSGYVALSSANERNYVEVSNIGVVLAVEFGQAGFKKLTFGTDGNLKSADGEPLQILSTGAGGAVSLAWSSSIDSPENIALVIANSPGAQTSGAVDIVVGAIAGPNIWTFDPNGALTLPTGVTNNGRIINDNGISLKVDSSYWTFGTDGSLTIPGDIQSEEDISIRINLADSTQRVWRFGEDGDLDAPGTVSAPNINATNHFMLPVYATEAARDSAITSPQPGMMVYVSSGEGAGLQVRGATQWNPVGGLTGV